MKGSWQKSLIFDRGREHEHLQQKEHPSGKSSAENMTPWERKLRYDFLRSHLVHFQRQKAIGNYIADFYYAKARLVIELDGGEHYMPQQAR